MRRPGQQQHGLLIMLTLAVAMVIRMTNWIQAFGLDVLSLWTVFLAIWPDFDRQKTGY